MPLRQRNGGERWVEKGKKGWTGAKGGAGGSTTTEIRKDDFQPDNSKGLAAWGIWIKKTVFASFSVKPK